MIGVLPPRRGDSHAAGRCATVSRRRRRALSPARPRHAATAMAAAMGLLGVLAPSAAAQSSVRGDFDGDGYADLAIGAPADSVQGQPRAGAVNVLYGTTGGLSARRDQQFTKAPQEIAGVPQPDAAFGAALATGDIDADGFADLAIGAPGEDVGALRPAPRSGAVTVLYGSSGGLRARPGASSFTQSSLGVAGRVEAGDRFGAALTIGDFDGDGRGDLAIGVPGEGIRGAVDTGAVNVLYGRAGGLGADDDQIWDQDIRGVKGATGDGHRFGISLAAGDVSGDGRAELAIGVPGGRAGGREDAGVVTVLYGRSQGLTAIDDLWSQARRGIKGAAETNDELGHAVAIGDFDGDGRGDLAVGVSHEGVNGDDDAGAVNVLYSSGARLGRRNQLLTQDTAGVTGRSERGDRLGAAVAAGDFNADGAADLAAGVPDESIAGFGAAGAVNVFFGSAAGIRPALEQFWSQESKRGVFGALGNDRFGSAVSSSP